MGPASWGAGGDEELTSAALSLRTTDGTSNGPAVWRTADATSVTAAETMTWNAGRPARSGTAAVGDFGAVPGRTRVAAPVTGLSGNGVVSFELAPQSGDGLDFLARETTTAGNRPHLVLTVTTG